jgi:hypothetical protein
LGAGGTDNNVAFERLELLDQLADKQEEIRSNQIAVGFVDQAMLTAILELPLDRQVTALSRYIQRMERTVSEISVQTVPAAEKEKTAASCKMATSPSSTCASLDSSNKQQHLLHLLEYPANVSASRFTCVFTVHMTP